MSEPAIDSEQLSKIGKNEADLGVLCLWSNNSQMYGG